MARLAATNNTSARPVRQRSEIDALRRLPGGGGYREANGPACSASGLLGKIEPGVVLALARRRLPAKRLVLLLLVLVGLRFLLFAAGFLLTISHGVLSLGASVTTQRIPYLSMAVRCAMQRGGGSPHTSVSAQGPGERHSPALRPLHLIHALVDQLHALVDVVGLVLLGAHPAALVDLG